MWRRIRTDPRESDRYRPRSRLLRHRDERACISRLPSQFQFLFESFHPSLERAWCAPATLFLYTHSGGILATLFMLISYAKMNCFFIRIFNGLAGGSAHNSSKNDED